MLLIICIPPEPLAAREKIFKTGKTGNSGRCLSGLLSGLSGVSGLNRKGRWRLPAWVTLAKVGNRLRNVLFLLHFHATGAPGWRCAGRSDRKQPSQPSGGSFRFKPERPDAHKIGSAARQIADKSPLQYRFHCTNISLAQHLGGSKPERPETKTGKGGEAFPVCFRFASDARS